MVLVYSVAIKYVLAYNTLVSSFLTTYLTLYLFNCDISTAQKVSCILGIGRNALHVIVSLFLPYSYSVSLENNSDSSSPHTDELYTRILKQNLPVLVLQWMIPPTNASAIITITTAEHPGI